MVVKSDGNWTNKYGKYCPVYENISNRSADIVGSLYCRIQAKYFSKFHARFSKIRLQRNNGHLRVQVVLI